MSSTIAVGVDGSAPGHFAVRWAIRRAAATGAALRLVHVIGTDMVSLGARTPEEAVRDANEVLAAEKDYALSRGPHVDVTLEVRQGNPMRELIQVSRDVDLVVVGTHKTGFIRGRVFGSRSIVLAAGSRTPVAVIPESTGRNRSGIIVGVDDSDASHTAVHFGAVEAQRTGDPLRLVSAWRLPELAQMEEHPENDRRHQDAVRDILEAQAARVRAEFPDVDVHIRLVRLPPAEALVDSSSSAALVVMGNSGPVGDGQGLLGSVAHDVLVNLAGPTVVVHADPAEQ
jgi:nucleotide-binding universal stress UspA family protein